MLRDTGELRAAVGFGMGTKELDNEITEDAFLIGGGYACGLVAGILEMTDAEAAALCKSIEAHLLAVLDAKSPDVIGE
jgi:hypothetical protein